MLRQVKLIGIALLLGQLIGCSTGNSNDVSRINSDALRSQAEPVADPASGGGQAPSCFREISFLDRSYTWPSSLRSVALGREFTLRNGYIHQERQVSRGLLGEYGGAITSLAYADITNDGEGEALVVINIGDGRTGHGTNAVFIFRCVNGQPQELWSFADGDRAHGGLRDIYSENGKLVIELWGENATAGSVDTIDWTNTPSCCAEHYTRSTYFFNGVEIVLSDQTVLDNPFPGSINGGQLHFINPRESSREKVQS